jgi:deoxyribodipyrimidine photolyase-related protein
MAESSSETCRTLVLVLGDQLDRESAVWEGFDARQDVVCMFEAAAEQEVAWTSKARAVMFLAAMRHFRDALADKGVTVRYRQLDQAGAPSSLEEGLAQAIRELGPKRVRCVRPGRHGLIRSLSEASERASRELELVADDHFLASPEAFDEWAQGRKQLRQEHFYRHMRRRTGVLMDGDQPAGGQWNFDRSNRQSFGREGPGQIKAPRSFGPDAVTREVIKLVNERLADHPGSCEDFDYPVTHKQALAALRDFVEHRLGAFGDYQDAMWTDRPWLYHSRLAAAMNLKLLSPRKVIDSVQRAWRDGHVPINAAEGFIRQVLGWREYVRGIYWQRMPEYLGRNFLEAGADLPDFYWTGQTRAECLARSIGQTLRLGYAHHIQRLMVTGQLAMLLGVEPRQVHRWYLAVYVDAVEWVELPNTLGMSQYADGGVMASKPYCASGKYIRRMSNYCGECPYDPDADSGEKACPFTTLFWDFLLRNEARLSDIPRMNMMLANARKLEPGRVRRIREKADLLRRDGF